MTTEPSKRPAQRERLTERAVAGAIWATFGVLGQRGLSLLSTVVLARLLMPSAYGLLGMALVVIAAVHSLRDLGTSSALIQRKDFSGDLASSVFWANVLFGAAGAGLIAGIAPTIAFLYGEPHVEAVLAVLAISFFITNLGVVQQAILVRAMAFRQLALIQMSASLVSAVVGVGMALSDGGVWSLVTALIADSVVTTVLLWVASLWSPRWHMDLGELRSVTSYSLNLTGSRILSYCIRNGDKALIGWYLGAVELGYYSLAFGLMMYPLHNATWTLGNVLFPAFAQIRDDHAGFRRAYLRAVAVLSTLTFPLMLGMVVTADVLVATCFGTRWLAMTPLVMLLAPVGMLQSIVTTTGLIYTAKGRTDWMFRWALLEAALAFAAFVVGLRWNAVGVAAAYALVCFLLSVPALAVAFRLIDLTLRELGRVIWPALKHALLMCAAVVLVRLALASAHITTAWILFGVMVGIGAGVYVALFLLSRPPFLPDLLHGLHAGLFRRLRRLAALYGD